MPIISPGETHPLENLNQATPNGVNGAEIDAAVAKKPRLKPKGVLRQNYEQCAATLTSAATNFGRTGLSLLKSFCRVRKHEEDPVSEERKRKRRDYEALGMKMAEDGEEDVDNDNVLRVVVGACGDLKSDDDEEEDDNDDDKKKNQTGNDVTKTRQKDPKKKKKKKERVVRHCCLLHRDNFFVRHARMLVDWPPFEAFILLAIAANCLVMAMESSPSLQLLDLFLFPFIDQKMVPSYS